MNAWREPGIFFIGLRQQGSFLFFSAAADFRNVLSLQADADVGSFTSFG